MSNRSVTLLGGPADLQRHMIPAHITSYRVAALPQNEPASVSYYDFFDPTCPVKYSAEVHTYVIRQVGRTTFVGVHETVYR